MAKKKKFLMKKKKSKGQEGHALSEDSRVGAFPPRPVSGGSRSALAYGSITVHLVSRLCVCGFLWHLMPVNAGDKRDSGLIPGLGRSPGGGNGNPLQYSCLENPMDLVGYGS